jgi:hypothetical protein
MFSSYKSGCMSLIMFDVGKYAALDSFVPVGAIPPLHLLTKVLYSINFHIFMASACCHKVLLFLLTSSMVCAWVRGTRTPNFQRWS